MADDVQALLARRYPSYREPLQIAWAWNRSGDPVKLAQANTLLTGLLEPYAHVLHVWYELAYGLVKQKKPAAALERLEMIGEGFRGMLDEDTLSLWGRCYKDRGDEFRSAGLTCAAGRPERVAAFTEADRAYQDACTRYEQAYALNKNWFPGINLATLWFLRAALAHDLKHPQQKDAMLAASRRLAEELLNAADTWQECLKDDNIWIRATTGEGNLLCGNWDAAAVWYLNALKQPNREPDHPNVMKAQVARIAAAYRMFGTTMSPPFDDLEAFFEPPLV